MKNQKLISRNVIRRFLGGTGSSGVLRRDSISSRNYDLDMDSIFGQQIADTIRVVADTLKLYNTQRLPQLRTQQLTTSLKNHSRVQFKNLVNPNLRKLYIDTRPEYYYLHTDTVTPQDTVLVLRPVVVQPDTIQVQDSIPILVLDSTLINPLPGDSINFPPLDNLVNPKTREFIDRLYRPQIRLGRSSENTVQVLDSVLRRPVSNTSLIVSSEKKIPTIISPFITNLFKNGTYLLPHIDMDPLGVTSKKFWLINNNPGIGTAEGENILGIAFGTYIDLNLKQNNQLSLLKRNNLQSGSNSSQSRLLKSDFISSPIKKLADIAVREAKKQNTKVTPTQLSPQTTVTPTQLVPSMKEIMIGEILAYMANGNQIKGLNSVDDLYKLEDSLLENVYRQIQRIYRDLGTTPIEYVEGYEPPKQEEKKELEITTPVRTIPYNRADIRSLIRNKGYNPYSDYSAGLRRKLRKYLNKEDNQLYEEWMHPFSAAPFVVFKKNGGLLSKNPINRFKYGK